MSLDIRLSPLAMVAAVPAACGVFAAPALMFWGGIILFVDAQGTNPNAPAWWIGGLALVGGILLGLGSFAVLRHLIVNAMRGDRSARGLFQCPAPISDATLQCSIQLAEHFGLPVSPQKPPLPGRLDALLQFMTPQVLENATIMPAQHKAARSALASTLGINESAIATGGNPLSLFPAGTKRFDAWMQLRQKIPGLPNAAPEGWVEMTTRVIVLAVLIACGVGLATMLDHNPGTQIAHAPGAAGQVVGHLIGLALFIILLGGAMIPVRQFTRRYACKLPPEFNQMGAFARLMPPPAPTEHWTPEAIQRHVCAIVASAFGIEPKALRKDTPLSTA